MSDNAGYIQCQCGSEVFREDPNRLPFLAPPKQMKVGGTSQWVGMHYLICTKCGEPFTEPVEKSNSVTITFSVKTK